MSFIQRTTTCAALFLALLAGVATAGDNPPCAISNHYILDPYHCPGPEFVTQTPSWQPTGNMSVARSQHSATLLANGKVLVVGGRGERGILDSAELYDFDTGTWAPAGRMSIPRDMPVATLLADGRVLVTGGVTDPTPPDFGRSATAELFDPATGTWSRTGNMLTVRDAHAAVRLQDGKVLVAGGWDNGPLASAELYDPGTGTWSQTGSLNVARYWHSMTLLQDGRVLAAKGSDDGDLVSTLASAEVYDPATRKWTRVADSGWGSVFHTATLLASGKVLFTSGNGGGVGGDVVYHSAELFDPGTATWTAASFLLEPRYQHTATLLASGAVLVTGGAAQFSHFPTLGYVTRAAVEWFDPATSAWSSAADMSTPRIGHTATALLDGSVLVAGGCTIGGPTHRSAEILKLQLAVPPNTVIEYRNLRDFPGDPGGHYFYTDAAAEIAALDLEFAGRFTRTGRTFKSGGSKRLCRFYGSVHPGPNSHFFTLSDDECAQLKAQQRAPPPANVPQWNYEGLVFGQEPPAVDASGASCPEGTTPVFRAYNNSVMPGGGHNATDSAHRFTTSHADIDELVQLFGWRDEGLAFCSRP
jgi:N-acetylneuraminic acid mutarotase